MCRDNWDFVFCIHTLVYSSQFTVIAESFRAQLQMFPTLRLIPLLNDIRFWRLAQQRTINEAATSLQESDTITACSPASPSKAAEWEEITPKYQAPLWPALTKRITKSIGKSRENWRKHHPGVILSICSLFVFSHCTASVLSLIYCWLPMATYTWL